MAGIKKHKYAKDLLERYQRMYGDRGLRAEDSWKDNMPASYNEKGSVRIDVLDVNSGDVYDYKFTVSPGKGLSQRQKDRILNHGP